MNALVMIDDDDDDDDDDGIFDFFRGLFGSVLNPKSKLEFDNNQYLCSSI